MYAIGIERCILSICGNSALYRPFFQEAFYDVGLFMSQRDHPFEGGLRFV